VRLSWIRHLPSIVASVLLFGFVGMPLGAIVFLTTVGIVEGKPFAMLGILLHPGAAGTLTAFFGAVPAFITGLSAGFVRIHVRCLLALAILMAPIGAIVTAIYLVILMMAMGSGVPLIGMIILTGGIAAFCCSFLLWRNRPWLI
jgi:hypothetical protein